MSRHPPSNNDDQFTSDLEAIENAMNNMMQGAFSMVFRELVGSNNSIFEQLPQTTTTTTIIDGNNISTYQNNNHVNNNHVIEDEFGGSDFKRLANRSKQNRGIAPAATTTTTTTTTDTEITPTAELGSNSILPGIITSAAGSIFNHLIRPELMPKSNAGEIVARQQEPNIEEKNNNNKSEGSWSFTSTSQRTVYNSDGSQETIITKKSNGVTETIRQLHYPDGRVEETPYTKMLDKYDPETYNHKYATINGIPMHYVDENSSSKNPLLLLHGWPDLWLGWREQISFLVDLGYRVIVPSLRGFGETYAPSDPNEYGFGTVSKDLAGLLDHLELPTVTVIGHDWGGFLAWRMSQFYPEKVKAVASYCSPYLPPATQDLTLEQLVQVLPNLKYQLYLVSPPAEKDINDNLAKFFRRIYRPVHDVIGYPLIDPVLNTFAEGREDRPRHEILPEKVLDYYVKIYTKSGTCSGINWYKQSHNNYVQCKDLDPIIKKPALMVIAELDPALPPFMAQNMANHVPGVEMHTVSGTGHWILLEKPKECNSLLKDFLARVDPISP